jgi:anthranilate synthase/phosphoribosyltransferase
MILILDNYDSFTYNVFQMVSRLAHEDVQVVRNDAMSVAEIEKLSPSRIILSPGPGRPEDAGITVELIRHCKGKIPLLGICLGHQAIGYAFGASIVQAKRICHGEAQEIALDGRGLFRTIGQKGTFTRYHSLVIDEKSLPEELEITARSSDGDIMGVRHREFLIEGIQFHPESVASSEGEAIIKAFLHYRRDSFPFKVSFEKVIHGLHLTQTEAEAFMEELTDGNMETAQVAAFLTALAIKKPTAEEIAGCAAILQRKKTVLPLRADLVVTDTCGTGGDGQGSFNISSMAALVAAACGLPIAKHGNRAVSSKAGSADFYEALGIPINLSPAQAAQMLEATGFVFLFAPLYHGAMKHAAPARKALGIKTIMNLLGPLSNPAHAAYQVIGVYDKELLEVVARAAHLLGVQRVLTVHSQDGFDEISPAAPTDMVEIDASGQIRHVTFDPVREGFRLSRREELVGGSASENACLAWEILRGAGRPALRTAIAYNAGAALYVAGRAPSLREGARMAADSLATGKVTAKIKEIIDYGQDVLQGLSPAKEGAAHG